MMRLCQHCGAKMERPKSMGARDWLRKRFCSKTCRVDSGWGARTGIPLERIPQRLPDADALFSRIMAVYRRTANERGLANEWEAAVQLGMAA